MTRPSEKIELVIEQVNALQLQDGTLQLSPSGAAELLCRLRECRMASSDLEAKANAVAVRIGTAAHGLKATAALLPKPHTPMPQGITGQ